jgi:hypothetical protein
MGDNLELVWAEFSTISKAVSIMNRVLTHVEAQPYL